MYCWRHKKRHLAVLYLHVAARRVRWMREWNLWITLIHLNSINSAEFIIIESDFNAHVRLDSKDGQFHRR